MSHTYTHTCTHSDTRRLRHAHYFYPFINSSNHLVHYKIAVAAAGTETPMPPQLHFSKPWVGPGGSAQLFMCGRSLKGGTHGASLPGVQNLLALLSVKKQHSLHENTLQLITDRIRDFIAPY